MRVVRGTRVVSLVCWLLLAGSAALSAGVHTPLGTQSVPNEALLPPVDCASCHFDYDAQNHIEPFDTWAGSMMANAARDPIFWAALDVANNDGEELGQPGIGEFCLRCHAPWGWLEARANADPGPPLAIENADGCALGDGGGQTAIDDPDTDFEGLTCHFCHRMMVNPSPPMGQEGVYYENANFWLDDGNCPNGGSGPCRRGPYNYPPNPAAPHEWAFSNYHVDNEICGNCHNVSNPYLLLRDENGDPIPDVHFPIERTFKEWLQSDFSIPGNDFQNCSDCHMPDSTADPVYASRQAHHNRTGDLPVHQFAGGNAWIPQVLKNEYPALGRTDAFDATTAWAEDLLQNQSATVDIQGPQAVDPGDTLTVDVTVTNLTGHKLPTGYGEGRRMWLHVEARDGGDTLIWESGAYEPTTGILTLDDQIKVYEVQQGIWNYNGTGACDVVDNGTGKHLFHFVKNDCIALDNRIPPMGFTGGSDPETQPVDYVYPEVAPGVLAHSDTTGFDIPVPGNATLPITVTATLRYQTASKEYIEFLRDEAIDPAHPFPDDCIQGTRGNRENLTRGEALYAMWTENNRSHPVDMDSAIAGVTLPATLFVDGFESGDTTAWSSSIP